MALHSKHEHATSPFKRRHKQSTSEPATRGVLLNPLFARLAASETVPRDELPEHESLPDTVAEVRGPNMAVLCRP